MAVYVKQKRHYGACVNVLNVSTFVLNLRSYSLN